MGGQVVRVLIECLMDTSDGPQRMTVNLESLRAHCRPERVEELIDDLLMLSEDVQAGRRPEEAGRPNLGPDRNLRRIK
jgi:hypothetical protein